ncbi:MAG: hypothetical protein M0P61_00520 [Ignavibacteriaceae bacterium]|jgi:hypothetical protein|nr:hypothetical protein [Ignavibacteriaceae bacterium]
MITQFNIADTTVKIFGTKSYANGSPNLACLVILICEITGLEAARTTTNKYGYYEFVFNLSGFVFGNYQVKFYGSDTRPKFAPLGDWEVIPIGDPKEATLLFNQLPTVGISESATEGDKTVDVNQYEMTTAKIDLSGIDIKSGEIAMLAVFYMEHTTGITEEQRVEKLRLFRSFKVQVIDGVTTYTFKNEIKLYEKPCYYDFRIQFIGRNLLYSPDAEGNPAKIDINNIAFDGLEDLKEYYGVYDAVIKNGTVGGEVQSLFVKLGWTEFRDKPKTYFGTGIEVRSGYDDSVKTLTYGQAKLITSYVVYMYVSDTETLPANLYPGNGSLWNYCGEFPINSAEIRSPAFKWCGYWIGFRMRELKEQSVIQKIVLAN